MSEFRRNPIIGHWVIIHKSNSWGPEMYIKEDHPRTGKETCQFCPGREHFTPPEIAAYRENGSPPNSSDWKMRIVPNKFPALRIEGEANLKRYGVFEQSNGIGAHEVLIETPDHERDFADLSVEEITRILAGYQERINDLEKDRRFKYVMIFKNYGARAGASVEHAHSQIIALPMVPKHVLQEIEGAKTYFANNGRCAFCDMIHQDMEGKERVVTQSDRYIAVSPFVPRYAFENWILPKVHKSQFSKLDHEEISDLASVLSETLRRIKACLSDPPYNFYLHIAPINENLEESYHWHIEIVPNLSYTTGFEWGTGFYVVHTEPADAARYLREADIRNS